MVTFLFVAVLAILVFFCVSPARTVLLARGIVAESSPRQQHSVGTSVCRGKACLPPRSGAIQLQKERTRV